ncbi:MAG: nucleotidyl transferase AbiEii/AbiGii toxin family protein [Candidatus Peribacteria bacterium]|nr:nucleotidyl transferase AbiEii/AbiGii toxin family protein [Candidatus Peribacteria bacterium]
MITDIMKQVLKEHVDSKSKIKVGYLKEVIQSEVLDFIYRDKGWNTLFFYGGTAMRFLLGLNRLSEDLDFVGGTFSDFEGLAQALQAHFQKQHILEVEYKIQKFRISLKFRNLLSQFNLNYENSSDLYLKIEISDHFAFCQDFEMKMYPVLVHNKSMLIRSFDESTLFATKLNAVLYRQRAKRNNDANVSVKGRDFYDLFWYLSHKIVPNVACVQDVATMEELRKKLITVIENTDFSQVVRDIEPFLEDDQMLDFFETNGKSYLIEQIQKLS